MAQLGPEEDITRVSELSNDLMKLETCDKLEPVEDKTRDKTNSTVNVLPANNDQIDADMMQIDSILKALNSGTFDQGNMMAIDHLTAKKPKVCKKCSTL